MGFACIGWSEGVFGSLQGWPDCVFGSLQGWPEGVSGSMQVWPDGVGSVPFVCLSVYRVMDSHRTIIIIIIIIIAQYTAVAILSLQAPSKKRVSPQRACRPWSRAQGTYRDLFLIILLVATGSTNIAAGPRRQNPLF